MKIFSVNQYVRDPANVRNMNQLEHFARPWRVFTYTVVAESPQAAIELVEKTRLRMAAWSDVFCVVNDEEGVDLDEPVYVGCGDITEYEAQMAKRRRSEQNCPGHEFTCTGTAYGGDDESYHGEGRCVCIHCGADGDA